MPVEIKCQECGKLFSVPPSRANAKYCSWACAKKNNSGAGNGNWKGGLVELVCTVCGKEFRVKNKCIRPGKTNSCSKACGRKIATEKTRLKNRTGVIKKCKVCGKEIYIKKCHQETEGTYCSRKCMAEDYSTLLTSNENPNWRGGEVEKICPQCGKSYFIAPAIVNIRTFCSKSCSAMSRLKNMNFPKSNAKGGKRADIGIFVRSAWEANYARYLNWLVAHRQIKSWEYEPDVFYFENIKRGTRSYLPDFKVENNDGTIEYHEVKVWMDAVSKTKLKRMKKYYPDVKIVLVDKPVYNGLARTVSKLVANWE